MSRHHTSRTALQLLQRGPQLLLNNLAYRPSQESSLECLDKWLPLQREYIPMVQVYAVEAAQVDLNT